MHHHLPFQEISLVQTIIQKFKKFKQWKEVKQLLRLDSFSLLVTLLAGT